MSEEKKEPQEGQEGGAPAAKPKAAEPAPVVMAGVVLVALLIGAALGALVLAPRVISSRQQAALAEAKDPHAEKGKKKKDKKHEKKKEGEGEGKAKVYRLDNIIVNPANSDGQRFLMCSIAIQADDPEALDVLREHEIELRDRVVTLLAAESLESLTAAGVRDSLRQRILTAIVPVLGEEGEGVELQVYLPQFVIQ
ncbi:MAG: flagellar basal body-associated FliL family protein [Candidatus Eisenbacteria bacterium]|nr:flagellar basal body-associated FliL family protein [Candidatus Eisenbacteria bacterium]